MTTKPRDTPRGSAATEKPAFVQEWLDGKITTRDAIFLAVLSDDPAVRIWGYHLFGVMVTPPTSFVMVTNVC